MKKIILCVLLTAAFYNLLAQKTINDPNVEKRNVGSFHGINVATGIKLILTEGSTEELAVSAAKTEFRDKIITEVENGILNIHYDTKLGSINKMKNENKKLRAYVSYKKLDKLDVNTGAEAEINGVLSSTTIDLQATTGGTVTGAISTPDLKITQNTGSKITLTGKADNLDVKGNTGSKFLGEELTTTTCSASASTGARINIWVQKELNAKAHTGGNIRYKGDGGIRDIKTGTGGSISRI
jgi:hypothetical protein